MKRVIVLFAAITLLIACTEEPAPIADPCKCVDIINNQDTENVTFDSCVYKMQFDPKFSLAFKKCQYAQITGGDTASVVIPENKTAELTIPADGRYELDLEKSQIRFIGKNSILDKKHTALFKLSEGFIITEDTSLSAGEFVIDMNSLTGTKFDNDESRQKFEGHLKSPDFFYTEKYPTATLKLISANDRIYKIKTKAELTIKGKTQEMDLNVLAGASGERDLKISGSVIINRTDFGINYGSGSIFDDLGDNIIEDQVPVVFDLHLKRVD
jgi:polyisoprenoid-binding protein YceI